MFFFFGDETNKTRNDGEFFLYGGLILSDEQAVSVHRLMLECRAFYGLEPDNKIKFTPHAKPDRLSDHEWRGLKATILEGLADLDGTFMAYYVHHDIIKKQTLQVRNQWALEAVLYRFQTFLSERGDYGFAVLDNIDENELRRLDLARINGQGLRFNANEDPIPLDRLLGIARSHVDWSHCLSANDVVLGSLAYSINHPDNDVTGDMMRLVNRLLWVSNEGEIRIVSERGLICRPLTVNVPSIRARYEELGRHLERLLRM